jgi:LPXTG-site transpeptidase (sortase) family protein
MQPKKISLPLYVVGFLAIVFFLIMVVFLLNPELLSRINLASLLGQINSSQPARLKIPNIDVNAAIEQVSITSYGSIGVPKGIANVGWFNLGPRPGERGNSIIVGHYGWYKNGTPAIFNNISKLKPGDKLYIQDSKGATITFVVRELKIFDSSEDTSGVFSLDDGKAHLNLITCEGVWDETQKTYSNRLVVFTDKE